MLSNYISGTYYISDNKVLQSGKFLLSHVIILRKALRKRFLQTFNSFISDTLFWNEKFYIHDLCFFFCIGCKGLYFEGIVLAETAACICSADMTAPGSTNSVTTLWPWPSCTDIILGGGVNPLPSKICFSRSDCWSSTRLLADRTDNEVDGRLSAKGELFLQNLIELISFRPPTLVT